MRNYRSFALILVLIIVSLLIAGCSFAESVPELDQVRESAESAATKAAQLASDAAPAAQTVAAEAREAGTTAADVVSDFGTRAPTIIAGARQTSSEAAATAKALATRLPTVAAAARQTGSEVAGTAEALATEGAPATLAANAEAFAITASETAQTTLGPIYTIVNNELGIVQPGADGQTIINVDEQLVNALILIYVTPPQTKESAQPSSPSLRPQLEELNIAITPEHITVIGRLLQPIRTPFEFHLIPSVVSGQLQFDLVNAQFGSVAAPDIIVGLTENAFNSAANRLTQQLPEGFVLNDIVLGNGQMQLIGRFG